MRLSPAGFAALLISSGSLIALSPRLAASAHALVGTDFASALAAAAELLLLLLSGWLLSCLALHALAARLISLRLLANTLTPAFLRRALFLGAVGALAIAPVATASNTNGYPAGDQVVPSNAQLLAGLRLPDWPTTATPRPVTVRAGDSLWEIAARELDDSASNSDIALAARRWYYANRLQIGADPNLIFPGQKLTPPTKDSQ